MHCRVLTSPKKTWSLHRGAGKCCHPIPILYEYPQYWTLKWIDQGWSGGLVESSYWKNGTTVVYLASVLGETSNDDGNHSWLNPWSGRYLRLQQGTDFWRLGEAQTSVDSKTKADWLPLVYHTLIYLGTKRSQVEVEGLELGTALFPKHNWLVVTFNLSQRHEPIGSSQIPVGWKKIMW